MGPPRKVKASVRNTLKNVRYTDSPPKGVLIPNP
jgi:hypothetical protein